MKTYESPQFYSMNTTLVKVQIIVDDTTNNLSIWNGVQLGPYEATIASGGFDYTEGAAHLVFKCGIRLDGEGISREEDNDICCRAEQKEFEKECDLMPQPVVNQFDEAQGCEVKEEPSIGSLSHLITEQKIRPRRLMLRHKMSLVEQRLLRENNASQIDEYKKDGSVDTLTSSIALRSVDVVSGVDVREVGIRFDRNNPFLPQVDDFDRMRAYHSEHNWSETEEEGSDYDPKGDEEQGIADAGEDLFEESSSETESEEEKELEDEEEMIKLEAFETEWNSTFDNICKVAQRDRQTILDNVRWQFEEAIGDVLQDAFKTFYGSDLDEDVEEDLCDVDSSEFRAEFEEVLHAARGMAKVDEVYAIWLKWIYDISDGLCDREPDVEQISQIFGLVKDAFADEAQEEFLDLYADKEHSDSDYDVLDDLDDYGESEQGKFDYLEEEEEVCDVDPQQFRKEFDGALRIVRDVAKLDQELLVNGICNMHNDLRLEEPNVQQLSDIFGAVKEELADEAREQFDDEEQEEKKSDSDYDAQDTMKEMNAQPIVHDDGQNAYDVALDSDIIRRKEESAITRHIKERISELVIYLIIMPDVLDTLRLVWLLGFVAIIAGVICRLRLYRREEGERFMLEGGLKGDVVLNSDHVIDRGTTQNGFKYYLQNLIHRSLYEMAEIIDSLDMTSVFLTLFVIGALCTTNRMTAYVLWDEEEEPLARMEREGGTNVLAINSGMLSGCAYAFNAHDLVEPMHLIQFDFVESTAYMMPALGTRQNPSSLYSIEIESDFERMGKINRLSDDEFVSSFNGVVLCLKKVYDQIQTDKLYSMHQESEGELMKKAHEAESKLVRISDEEEERIVEASVMVEKVNLILVEMTATSQISQSSYEVEDWVNPNTHMVILSDQLWNARFNLDECPELCRYSNHDVAGPNPLKDTTEYYDHEETIMNAVMGALCNLTATLGDKQHSKEPRVMETATYGTRKPMQYHVLMQNYDELSLELADTTSSGVLRLISSSLSSGGIKGEQDLQSDLDDIADAQLLAESFSEIREVTRTEWTLVQVLEHCYYAVFIVIDSQRLQLTYGTQDSCNDAQRLDLVERDITKHLQRSLAEQSDVMDIIFKSIENADGNKPTYTIRNIVTGQVIECVNKAHLLMVPEAPFPLKEMMDSEPNRLRHLVEKDLLGEERARNE